MYKIKFKNTYELNSFIDQLNSYKRKMGHLNPNLSFDIVLHGMEVEHCEVHN